VEWRGAGKGVWTGSAAAKVVGRQYSALGDEVSSWEELIGTDAKEGSAVLSQQQ